MILYRTATKLRHSTIQSGTKTTSQLHETSPSSLSGRNTNCSALTAQNSSSSNERSCLTAQTQAPTLAALPNISGMNTSTQRCRPEVSRSQASSSNISKIKCNESDISIALKCEYESPSTLERKVQTRRSESSSLLTSCSCCTQGQKPSGDLPVVWVTAPNNGSHYCPERCNRFPHP